MEKRFKDSDVVLGPFYSFSYLTQLG